MADTNTTHLNLVKQDPAAVPDYEKDHSNLDTLDSEVWARGKSFNGQTVGADGGFHVNSIPEAENLQTSASQRSNDTYVVRPSGGEASIPQEGDAWLMLIKGSSVHTGYTPQSIEMTVTPMEREEGVDAITATINESTFVSYVDSSGTITLTYSTSWSADPANYGITVTGTPIAGDVITVVYVKEVRGTITQSDPSTFVSCGWNLYNHSAGYARVLKYSTQYNFKIAGTYTALEFSTTPTGSRVTISPVSGGFSIPNDGYVHVTGGNNTDTVIWMTWSDWGSGYNWTGGEQGSFKPYEEHSIDISSVMSTYFPYGLMQVGTVQDEINLNVGVATSKVQRLAYNSTNLASAVESGRQYEYDENYIYLEKETPSTYDISVNGGYTAFDHGMEWFTNTDVGVYAETVYGANLKNKLERDVLTISQQSLTAAEQTQAKKNLGFEYKNLGSFSTQSALVTALNTEVSSLANYMQENVYFNFSAANGNFASATAYQGYIARGGSANYCTADFISYTYGGSLHIHGVKTSSGWSFITPGMIITGTNATSLSVANTTYTSICSLTLTPGTWIIVGGHRWESNFSGVCVGDLRYGSSDVIPGTTTRYDVGNGGGVNMTGILSCSANTAISLTVYQSSGSAKTASYVSLKAICIG